MKCDNCRCVVPDTCEYCMYCGHKVNTGSEKTIPVSSKTENVTYYEPFPNATNTHRVTQNNRPPQPPRWGAYNGYGEYNGYSDYDRYGDRGSGRRYDYTDCRYYDSPAYDRGRPDYTYRNTDRVFDDYARYNGYNSYGVPYDYSNREPYGNHVNNDDKMKFIKLLIGVVAVDVVFMLIVLLMLLLVKI